jgi:nicotinamide-nucleotide amidase
LLSYDREPAVVRQRLYKTFGLAEARIGELLEGLAGREEGVLLGYYPNFPENHVSVTIRGRTVGQTEEALERLGREVEAVLAPYVVARDGASLEEAVGRVLTERGLTLAVAESCTGGLIGHRLTSVSGSSAYFERGVVAYSNRSKIALLGVRPEVLERYGAVSAETARAMAEGARTSSGASLGLATTGIAGPTGGTPDKPVGTVYIALDSGQGAEAEHFLFPGDRAQVKMLTAETALARLLRFLKP